MKNCVICEKKINQLQFRKRTRCNACNTKIRRLRTKLKAIELLGGKCVRCGYKEHPAALEFHHKIPQLKNFEINTVANKSWNKIHGELLKCELLCSNCHRIEHSVRFDEIFMNNLNND